MTWMRGLAERLRELVARKEFDAELDEEIRYHIERETERLMTTGMSPERARQQAMRTFGGVDQVKEGVREGAGLPWLESAARDARHALRGLRRNPGFAVAAVVTLGLGVGVTTAIYSVVDSVLLEPLPYPEPDRLVRMVQQNSPDNRWNLSMADFLAIEEQEETFEAVAAFQTGSMSLTGRGRPEQIPVVQVSADWFRVLGVEPAEGRGFVRDEDVPGATPVVVLSAALAGRLFESAQGAVGASVTLDDVPHTVVGVLGPEHATLAGRTADAWPVLPLVPPARRGPFFLGGIGRLAPDRTLEDARADLDGISRRMFSVWSDGFGDSQARITPYPLEEIILGDVGGGLWTMLGAVVGVLLIAVANVGSLFLVRAAGRERELRLRASLGAGRGRLAAQLVIESLVVAAIGGVVGVALALAGLEALVAAGPSLPRLDEVGLDGSALLVTGSVVVAAALVFGLAPLARLATGRVEGPGGARGSTSGPGGWSRVRAALVTVEFAIAFGLSTGAGLLVGSFVRLQRVDPGYDADQVVAMRIGLPDARYGDYPEMQAFWSELLRRLGESPDVEAAGVGAALPPAGWAGTNNFDLLDHPAEPGESEPVALWNWASPGYLEALGVPLLRGRIFDEGDRAVAADAPVVVVSESWARDYYPDGEAIGARLYSGGDRSVFMTVIGVIGDVKYLGLDAADDAAVYEPHWQLPLRDAHLVVRGRGDAVDAVERARAVVAALDPELPLADVRTMAARTSDSLARPRWWTTLLGLFAALGLTLAAVGVYGVLSYWVGTQRKELAIRVSLGAEPSSVRRLVLARGMRLAAAGIALGAILSLALAGWMRSLVFGMSPHDPFTLAAVAAGLAGIAAAACAVPARSATRIDPAVVLKGE